MARYIATSGSYFEPFTYEQLAAPLQQATDAQNESIEAMDALNMQAGAIASMLDDSSPKFKALYDSFVKSTEEFSDDLWNNGYNAGTARKLSALRKTYGNDITKINAAITQKADAVKRYRDDVSKDRTLITSMDPSTLSLDEWYDNPYAGDYSAYSGTMLTAKASAVGENLKRDIIENPGKWESILGGQYFEKNEFIGFHAGEIDEAIDNVLTGKAPSSERVRLLQSAMQNVYNSSGMDVWASPDKKAQAYRYIGDGIYSAIGSKETNNLQDRSYTSPYQWAALEVQARGKNGTDKPQTVYPKIATLRGNILDGISDNVQRKDFEAKSAALKDLQILKQLQDSGTFKDEYGSLLKTAAEAANRLKDNEYMMENYPDLFKDRPTAFLSTMDYNAAIEKLSNEINGAETNDHHYSFQVTPAAAQNMARNVFKLNIGELTGKHNKDKVASVAKYADPKKDVTANDLLSVLDSENISIGFDAKRGEMTIQRNASGSGESTGSYNDKIIYLDPKTVLAGASAYANAASLLYIANANLPDNATIEEKNLLDVKIASLTNVGQIVDLRDLAIFLKDNYDPMVKNGSAAELAVYNSLVEAFGEGLFNSSNVPWAPNSFKAGWSANTGGENLQWGNGLSDDTSDTETE